VLDSAEHIMNFDAQKSGYQMVNLLYDLLCLFVFVTLNYMTVVDHYVFRFAGPK